MKKIVLVLFSLGLISITPALMSAAAPEIIANVDAAMDAAKRLDIDTVREILNASGKSDKARIANAAAQAAIAAQAIAIGAGDEQAVDAFLASLLKIRDLDMYALTDVIARWKSFYKPKKEE